MNGARNIVQLADVDALAEAAAERLIARMAARPNRISICLTGGSSPTHLYQLLGREPYRSQIPWPRTHWFIGDERFVPIADPLSNMGSARRLFLDRCAQPDHIHSIQTGAATPATAADLYEATLKSFYGANRIDEDRPLFDVVLMGVGPDGHTASLFPGDAALDEAERWVIHVDRAHVAPFVPRVTLTLPTLGACREMLFLVSGPDKRAILGRVLTDPELPAARAYSRNETTWLIDAAAMPEHLRA